MSAERKPHSVRDDLAQLRAGIKERVPSGWTPHYLALVDRLEEQFEATRAENLMWRKIHEISPDTPMLIPSDKPVPPEAIEMGRKLMAFYRPAVFAASSPASSPRYDKHVNPSEADAQVAHNDASSPASKLAAIIDTEPPSDEDVAYFRKLHERDESSPASEPNDA